jgi:crossover junction endodeoxyribonuclease RusA
MTYEIDLPFPPTENHYYTVARGRKILSTAGHRYLKQLALLLKRPEKPMEGSVGFIMAIWWPDKRRRDLANYTKPVCDALSRAGIYHDDSQIKYFTLYEAGFMKPGKTHVRVWSFTDDEWPNAEQCGCD